MPEGHKTHHLANQHRSLLTDTAPVITSPQGRFASDARKVSRRTIESIEAVGKQLFYHFEGNRIVQVHLGRYGSFQQQTSPPAKPVGQVRMRVRTDDVTIDLRGPTRCRVIHPDLHQEIIDSLGPDPLAGGQPKPVFQALSASPKPIAALLLDQSIIAGIGNILRAEILFEIGMAPSLPGCDLTPTQLRQLWKSTVAMMKKSLRYGQIISVTAKEAGKPLTKLGRKERFRVYGCEHCPRCGHTIATENFASRKLYYCPSCQAN
ncbi:MAG: zinc finger domain-containing protein [Planctomycetota bacterium]